MICSTPGEPTGWRRAWLVLRTSDPEPIEVMNALLLILTALTYLPLAWEPVAQLASQRLIAWRYLGWVTLAIGLLSLKLSLVHPHTPTRTAALALSVFVWVLVGTNLFSQFGINTRSLLCLIFAGAAAWAAIRVAQRGG